MRTRTVTATGLMTSGRLDAQHHLSPGVVASERIAEGARQGLRTAVLGEVAAVVHPNRFKRMLPAPGEASIPFLRAFDVFEYLPQASDHLSVLRTAGLDDLRVSPDTILITRSGRNLGPVVMVDRYLSQFIPSDDLIRVRPADCDMGFYLHTFLSTPTGHQLLRRDKTGSVIDHLSERQVAAQVIPIVSEGVLSHVVLLGKKSHELVEKSRLILASAIARVAAKVPGFESRSPLRNGWEIKASELGARFDVAPYAPHLSDLRSTLLGLGGVRLGEVARVRKPGGRYKTYYVEEGHGRPILSGRQLLQAHPVALKWIAERSFASVTEYELRAGWICFQADGRAEEHLGFPVIVTASRAGWLASGHVGRVEPAEPDLAGALWLALASPQVQAQLAALACGSVVDALYERDIADVALPPLERELGRDLAAAWDAFDTADALRAEAAALLETELAGGGL